MSFFTPLPLFHRQCEKSWANWFSSKYTRGILDHPKADKDVEYVYFPVDSGHYWLAFPVSSACADFVTPSNTRVTVWLVDGLVLQGHGPTPTTESRYSQWHSNWLVHVDFQGQDVSEWQQIFGLSEDVVPKIKEIARSLIIDLVHKLNKNDEMRANCLFNAACNNVFKMYPVVPDRLQDFSYFQT